MSRGLLAKVRRLLYRPLFGTFVVPKDARVDPALFPEDQFPVYCPKCSYLLRGLPDGPCPECGTAFERGTLLVGQYVFGWGGLWSNRGWLRKAVRWLPFAAVVCVYAPLVAGAAAALLHWLGLLDLNAAFLSDARRPWMFKAVRLAWLLQFVGLGLLLVALICLLEGIRRSGYRRKRRAVIAAIRAAASADEAGSDE